MFQDIASEKWKGQLVPAGGTRRQGQGEALGNLGDSMKTLVKNTNASTLQISSRAALMLCTKLSLFPRPPFETEQERKEEESALLGFRCGQGISLEWAHMANSSGIWTIGWSLVVWYLALG